MNDFERIKKFIVEDMRMSHVYQLTPHTNNSSYRWYTLEMDLQLPLSLEWLFAGLLCMFWQLERLVQRRIRNVDVF